MQAPPILECRDLSKVFRSRVRQAGWSGLVRSFLSPERQVHRALAGIELRAQPGEFIGLIGKNGAGKTTLVKCLTGIIPASSGSARLFGQDSFHLDAVRKRRLSLVMGQRSQLWWDLPPWDSFKLLAAIFEVEEAAFEARVRAFAERLDVEAQLHVQLRKLSLGQRMKMEIIGAFLHEPLIVFLDEPSIGLDLVSRETIRRFLVEINREREVTIVLTSHDMEDIEETCRRLWVLDEGGLLFDGDLVELLARTHDQRAIEVHLEPSADLDSKPGTPPAGTEVQGAEFEVRLAPFGARWSRTGPLSMTFLVPVEQTRPLVQSLFDWLPVRDLNIERQPLESLIRELFRGDRRDLEGDLEGDIEGDIEGGS